MAQKRRHPLEKTRRWYLFEANPHVSLSLSLLYVFFYYYFSVFCCVFFFFPPGGLAQWIGLVSVCLCFFSFAPHSDTVLV